MSTSNSKLLFVAHASQDQHWVQGVLIPSLGLDPDQYAIQGLPDPGIKVEGLAENVSACRYTLLVASAASKVDGWVQFAAGLAQRMTIECEKHRLLLVTRDFAPGSARAQELLPLQQRCLSSYDCSDEDASDGTGRKQRELARLAAELAVTHVEQPAAECPYPGLRTFGDGSASFHRPDLFFGRDAESELVVTALRDSGCVLLMGSSGCGKSSLVQAGVIPKLKQGPEPLAIAITRPGDRPDAALCSALDELDPRLVPALTAYLEAADSPAREPVARKLLLAATAGPGKLLYLDQFEEVFLDKHDPQGRRKRCFALLAALRLIPGLALLLSLRDDFYGDLARSTLWEVLKDHRVELAPLRGDALRLAITRPAELAGVHVEVDLVERLTREADADRASQALPLLQVVLEQLWSKRQWRYLSLESYERLTDGHARGLDVVLARHADAAIHALPNAVQPLAWRVLLDLVHLGEGRTNTRRRRSIAELRRAGDDAAVLATVIEHLAWQRLLSMGSEAPRSSTQQALRPTSSSPLSPPPDERHVDLAHDALIDGWPELANKISSRRSHLVKQRRLEARAAGKGYLNVSELPEFTDWVKWINTPEGRALGASETLLELERRSRHRRTNWRIGVTSTTIAIITVLAAFARSESIAKGRAQDNAIKEAAGRAVALAANASQERAARVTAIRTASEALRSGRAVPANVTEALAAAEGSPVRLLAKLVSSDGTESVACSSDGKRLLAVSPSGVRVLDDRGSILREFSSAGTRSAAMSKDATRVAILYMNNEVKVWDIDGSWQASFATDDGAQIQFLKGHDRLLVTGGAGKERGTIEVWSLDTATPQREGRVVTHRDQIKAAAAAATPEGTLVAAAGMGNDPTVRVLQFETGAVIREFQPYHAPVGTFSADAVAWSPDGKRLAMINGAKLRVWERATDRLAETLIELPSGVAPSLSFTADSQYLSLVTTNGTFETYRVASISEAPSESAVSAVPPPLLPTLRVQIDGLHGASYCGADDRLAVASSQDVAIWSLAADNSLRRVGSGEWAYSRATFLTNDLLAIATSDALEIWNRDGAFVARQAVSPNAVTGLAVCGDHTLCAFDNLGAAFVWAFPEDQIRVQDEAVFPSPLPVISPDGTRMAGGPDPDKVLVDGMAIVVRSLPDRSPLLTIPHSLPLFGRQAFSPDGRRLLVASGDLDREVEIWDLDAKTVLHTLPVGATVLSIAVAPDQRVAAVGATDAVARVYSLDTGKLLFTLTGHDAGINDIHFSPDSRTIATASADGTARLWDATSHQLLAVLRGHQREVVSVSFSPNGHTVLTASRDKSALLYPVTATDWLAHACNRMQGHPAWDEVKAACTPR